MRIQCISMTRSNIAPKTLNNQKNVTFGAQKYPSDVYSNWFVAQVKSFAEQEPETRDKLIENELAKYQKELAVKYKSFLQKLSGNRKRDLETRTNDYESLTEDLLKEKKVNGSFIDKAEEDNIYPEIDTPEGAYSSATDYVRRNPPRGPSDPLDGWRKTYGKENVDDPFWYPGN